MFWRSLFLTYPLPFYLYELMISISKWRGLRPPAYWTPSRELRARGGGRVLRARPPAPLAFSVFCFPLAPTTPDPLGPCTYREIKNARPRSPR